EETGELPDAPVSAPQIEPTIEIEALKSHAESLSIEMEALNAHAESLSIELERQASRLAERDVTISRLSLALDARVEQTTRAAVRIAELREKLREKTRLAGELRATVK